MGSLGLSASRRLVVVSFHFPPDPAIGGLRWAGLTRYLASDGWSSWILTVAPTPSAPTAGVTVESHPRVPTLNDAYRRWRAGRAVNDRARVPASGATQSSGTPTEGWFARLRREVSSLLSVPDEGRGWLVRATWATRRLIARVQPTVVVSSGPPHSAHIVACIASRMMGVRWIADLRDPWAGPFNDAWGETMYSLSGISRWLTTRLERFALPSASMIICNTREFAAVLKSRYPSSVIEFVPNAVDRALLPPISADPFPGLAIVHVGTIYGGRDLGPVLVALRAFLDRHPGATHDGTRLRVAGHIDEPYASVVRRQIAELKLDSQVEFLGILPRGEALQLVGRSRLAVVLAQHQDLQVPAKLYEMVAMKARTVVLAALDSAAASEARRLGGSAIDPDDIGGLLGVMEKAFDRARPVTPVSVAELDYQQLAVRVGRLLDTP